MSLPKEGQENKHSTRKYYHSDMIGVEFIDYLSSVLDTEYGLVNKTITADGVYLQYESNDYAMIRNRFEMTVHQTKEGSILKLTASMPKRLNGSVSVMAIVFTFALAFTSLLDKFSWFESYRFLFYPLAILISLIPSIIKDLIYSKYWVIIKDAFHNNHISIKKISEKKYALMAEELVTVNYHQSFI